MSRRFTTGPPVGTARGLGRRVARRVGGAVLAASVGALTASVAVSLLAGAPSQVQDPGAPDRTTDRPSRSQTREPEPAGGLVERLLPAEAWTSAAPGTTWRAVHTEPHEPRALAGSCHRFPLVSVGAIRVAHRAYILGSAADPRATAEHVVARFADARTARRAHEVLLAWRSACPETLADLPEVRLSGLREVDRAQRYAVTWDGPTQERVREDVALVQVGRRVALVRVTAAATDGSAGRAAVTDAVRDAGGLLG